MERSGREGGVQRVMPGLAPDQREAHPIGWPVIHYDLGQKHDLDQLDSFLRNLELGSQGTELHEQWGWSLKGWDVRGVREVLWGWMGSYHGRS